MRGSGEGVGVVTAGKDSIAVVRAWHQAVNQGNADELVALSHDDIEIGGPRGSAAGSAVLRDWVGRAGIQLEPRRWFAGPVDVVVEQVAIWRTSESGETEPTTIASSFRIDEGRVRRMVRFESLEEALAATDLTMQEEVPQTAS